MHFQWTGNDNTNNNGNNNGEGTNNEDRHNIVQMANKGLNAPALTQNQARGTRHHRMPCSPSMIPSIPLHPLP